MTLRVPGSVGRAAFQRFIGVATRPFEPERKTTMAAMNIARRKFSPLALASDLANVSDAGDMQVFNTCRAR